MIGEIKNVEDVSTFVIQLVAEGLNYHPDDDFNNYVNTETGEPSYTPEQALIRNTLNDQCFEICEKHGADIYDISMEIFLKETGLDKYIPLPSQSSS
jgi:hypothetical protein